jgi:hypothetical protein
MSEQRYGWVMVAIGALMTCVALLDRARVRGLGGGRGLRQRIGTA